MKDLSQLLTLIRSKVGVVLTLICVVIGVVALGGFVRARLKADQIVQAKSRVDEYLQTATALKTIWREGLIVNLDESLEGRCVAKTAGENGAPSAYFRCNADYLNCVIEEKKGLLQNQNSDLIVEVLPQAIKSVKRYVYVRNRASAVTKNSPHSAAHLILSTREHAEQFHVFLEDECGEAKLPEGIYSLGVPPPDGNEKLRWENKKRSILVDKYLVTKRDIQEWKLFGKFFPPELKTNYSVNDLPTAAINLLPEQMEKYCAFRGKQVLTSAILDAASFFPKEGIKASELDLRAPYPWARKFKSNYLYKARNQEDFPFNAEYCKKVFTKECRQYFTFYPHKSLAPTWIGIFHSLGGPLEYVRPTLSSDGNLKASSYYFDFRSEYHEIGKRLSWDGVGRNYKSLKEAPMLPEGALDIGFRCMRFSYE